MIVFEIKVIIFLIVLSSVSVLNKLNAKIFHWVGCILVCVVYFNIYKVPQVYIDPRNGLNITIDSSITIYVS